MYARAQGRRLAAKTSTNPRPRRAAARVLTVLPLVAGLIALTACGGNGQSAAGKAVSIDVGTRTLSIDSSKETKIAFFVEGTNNSAVAASVDAAQKKAKELGVKLDVFDGKFDAVTQRNQMQNALNRDYNAWVVGAVDGNLVCSMVTEQAPAKNIVTATYVLPICGRNANEGAELWAPGTTTYVGGTETPRAFKTIMERAIAENPGPQKVGVITGPELNPITQSFDKALAEIKSEHPEFQIVQEARTDYSTPVAREKAVPMLQANPDLSVIITAFSNMSRGAVSALQGAGKKPGDVKIYESGGTKWAVQALQDGWIESSSAFWRGQPAAAAVEAVVAARTGKPVERVILNGGHSVLPGGKLEDVFLLDKKNVLTVGYEPEID